MTPSQRRRERKEVLLVLAVIWTCKLLTGRRHLLEVLELAGIPLGACLAVELVRAYFLLCIYPVAIRQ